MKNTHMFELVLRRVVDPNKNWIFRKVQNQIFQSTKLFLIDAFKIDRKNLTKEQLNDDEQVICVKGDKEFCTKAYDGVKSIERNEINKFVEKVQNIRLLPKSIRHKIHTVSTDSSLTSFDFLLQYLGSFDIIITIDVKKYHVRK